MATRHKVRGVQVGEWLSVLQKQVSRSLDVVPDGWRRLESICKELGKSERATSAIIAREIRDNGAERKRFTIMASDGSVQSVWHFRLKK